MKQILKMKSETVTRRLDKVGKDCSPVCQAITQLGQQGDNSSPSDTSLHTPSRAQVAHCTRPGSAVPLNCNEWRPQQLCDMAAHPSYSCHSLFSILTHPPPFHITTILRKPLPNTLWTISHHNNCRKPYLCTSFLLIGMMQMAMLIFTSLNTVWLPPSLVYLLTDYWAMFLALSLTCFGPISQTTQHQTGQLLNSRDLQGYRGSAGTNRGNPTSGTLSPHYGGMEPTLAGLSLWSWLYACT